MKAFLLIILCLVALILCVRLYYRKNKSSRIKTLPRLYNKPFEALITQAQDLILFEEYNRIIAITDQILKFQTKNNTALELRALALEAINYNLEAIEDFELANSIKELDANMLGLFGLTFRKIGEFNKGQVFLKLSVEKGLRTYEGNYNVGNIASPLAIELMNSNSKVPENLQRRTPDDFVLYLTNSDWQNLIIGLKKQIHNLESGIEVDPKDQDYPRTLALAKKALNDYEQTGH